MTNETEKKNNANRLAYALYCISEDENSIKAVAQTLHYEPAQLQTDIKDLYKQIQIRKEINNE